MESYKAKSSCILGYMDEHLVCGLASVFGTVVNVVFPSMFIETTIQDILACCMKPYQMKASECQYMIYCTTTAYITI